jgi:hypothetical protein
MPEYAEDYNNLTAKLMNVKPHPTDVVQTTQRIMTMFNQMSIELHLMSTDEFVCVIKLTSQVPDGETIQ